MTETVVIDGSMGEGGGQILRTAVALAAIAGKKLKIINIRAKRNPPGLRPQHLTAVRAVAILSRGRLKGDKVGSMTLEFEPGTIKGGVYRFDVGTAGSIPLVLQALLPVAAYADGPVRVTVTGGTDVAKAPTIDYVREVLLSLLAMVGYTVRIEVRRRGHYPRGGGVVVAEIPSPPQGFKGRDFLYAGKLRLVKIRSHAVRLPRHVAERQAKSAAHLVERELRVKPEVELETYPPGRDPHLGPGSGVLVWAIFDETVMGGDSIGERGKPAERVGMEAARSLLEDVKTGAALDRHASDMMPLYLALAGGPYKLRGARLTSHAATLLELLKLILDGFDYKILEGALERPFLVELYSKGV